MMRDSARALEQKDFDKFAMFFTADFTCSTPDGTVLTRRQFLDVVNREMRTAVQPITISLKQVHLQINRDNAESASDETTEYAVTDAQGAVHQLRYSQRMEARLAKVAGRWRHQAIKYPSHSRMWLDGRVVDAEKLRRILGR